jgi:tetratricopeptide (TPR) repeat protein
MVEFDLDSGDKWASVIAAAIAVLGAMVVIARLIKAGLRSYRHKLRSARSRKKTRANIKQFRDAALDELGVHRTITVTDQQEQEAVTPGVWSTYVPRDFDDELRRVVSGAKVSSRFILLVGGSSTGKTRSAAEAVAAQLGDWQLVNPLTATQLDTLLQNHEKSTSIVVWLDELQLFLGDGRSAERMAAALVDLLDRPGHVLILGTLWPEYAHEYVKNSTPSSQSVALRALFARSFRITVPVRFSAAEFERCQRVAQSDLVTRSVLATSTGRDGAVTQTLAAGPDLIRHWTEAPEELAGAVITAAIDARRLGVEHPLTVRQLEQLSLGGLTPSLEARARITPKWFVDSLAYATEILRGAVSALQPILLDGSDQVGYAVADYLYQHAQKSRADALPTQRSWAALTNVIADGGDLERLGNAARQRGSVEAAEALYRKSLEAGNGEAAVKLADILSAELRVDDAEEVLRTSFDRMPQDTWAAYSQLLSQRGKWPEAEQVLRRAIEVRVDSFAGGSFGPLPYHDSEAYRGPVLGIAQHIYLYGPESELVGLLLKHDRRVEATEVWAHAVATGVPYAKQALAELLAQSGELKQAEQHLKECVAAKEPAARYALARLYSELDRSEDLLSLWRSGFLARETQAAFELSQLLEQRQALLEAQSVLEISLDYEPTSYIYLARLLQRVDRGSEAVEVLQRAVARSVAGARSELGLVQAETGELGEAISLFEAAFNAHEMGAWRNLARALLLQDFDSSFVRSVLETEISRGTRGAVGVTCRILMLRGQYTEAALRWAEVLPFADDQDRKGLAGLYAWQGDLEGAEARLRECVLEGVRYATATLVAFLTAIKRTDLVEREWRKAIAIGEFDARGRLADHLVSLGRIAEAETALRENLIAGDLNGGQRLARFLIGQDRLAEAERVLVDAIAAGEYSCAGPLFSLLIDRDKLDDAEALLRSPAHSGILSLNVSQAQLAQAKGDLPTAHHYLKLAVEGGEWQAADMLSTFEEAIGEVPSAGGQNKDVGELGSNDGKLECDLWSRFWREEWRAASELTDLLLNSHRKTEAESVALLAVVFGEYKCFFTLARVYASEGRPDEARRSILAGVASGQSD